MYRNKKRKRIVHVHISLYLTCLRGKKKKKIKDTILAIEKFNFTFSEVGDLQSGFYLTPVGKEKKQGERNVR